MRNLNYYPNVYPSLTLPFKKGREEKRIVFQAVLLSIGYKLLPFEGRTQVGTQKRKTISIVI